MSHKQYRQSTADIKAKVSILNIIGQTVELRAMGREYRGLCPFHAEKTGSFYVNPEKGVWHCMGCGAGGDVITFVAKRDGVSTGEAIRSLSKIDRSELTPTLPTFLTADTPVAKVPEAHLPWYRAQRKAQFDALVSRLAALETRQVSLERRFQAKGPEGITDDDWSLLGAITAAWDALEQDVAEFWERDGLAALPEFLIAYGQDALTEHELAIHLRRPVRHPSAERPDAEWLPSLQPMGRGAVRAVREAMGKAPITNDETIQAMARYGAGR